MQKVWVSICKENRSRNALHPGPGFARIFQAGWSVWVSECNGFPADAGFVRFLRFQASDCKGPEFCDVPDLIMKRNLKLKNRTGSGLEIFENEKKGFWKLNEKEGEKKK